MVTELSFKMESFFFKVAICDLDAKKFIQWVATHFILRFHFRLVTVEIRVAVVGHRT